MNIFKEKVNEEDYFVVTYFLESDTSVRDASFNLAVGQSIGNPNIRNQWETDELFEKYSCIVLDDESRLKNIKASEVKIAFPLININLKEDGVSQLLCMIMGGQLDIDCVKKCFVQGIEFPKNALKEFKGPKNGITGIRDYLSNPDRPILGTIVKPKTGLDLKTLVKVVEELIQGGAEFIKEDEILSSPAFCKLEDRVKAIAPLLKDSKVIYSFCINADPPWLLKRAECVAKYGGNSVHVNVWSGLGSYKSLRELDLPLFLHFQKSGDQAFTNKEHSFHFSWRFICDLAGLMGVDFIHAGMWGGYLNQSELELKEVMSILTKRNVMPALSCGMHPGLVKAVENKFGSNFMANVGGAVHGHPNGTLAGVKAMKQAINGIHGEEYEIAIKKWGLVP
jgi:ribulose-bisphosphate carboxylase large chain